MAFAAYLGAPCADARTWYVTPTGSGDAPTIRAALDSALAGDVVLLAPGTYSKTSQGIVPQPPDFGMIRILKPITLRSEGGPEVTILDAERQARVIYCENAGEVCIEGLTLTRGVAYGKLSGAGCFADENTRPKISNCVILDCGSGGDGGGVSCTNAVLTNCVVRNCLSQNYRGGGIFCENSTITNCQILDNRVGPQIGFGGGIYCRGTVIRDCLIRGNLARGDGGAFGGGIYAEGGGGIVNCWIEGNAANDPGTGGAGGVFAGNLPIRDCTFVNNTALTFFPHRAPRGGGALTSGEVSDCIFVGNRAVSSGLSAEGGAVYGEFSSFSMTRCTLVANTAIGGANPVGGVFALAASAVTSTIIAFNEGFGCGGSPVLTCCDLFGNSLGDALCATGSGDNFSADPQFCATDPASSLIFTLQKDSPCAPGRHPTGAACGTIGAKETGCGAVSVETRSWSTIKAMYR